MKWISRRQFGWCCGLVLIAFAPVVFLSLWFQNSRDREDIERLTKDMKTVCVGRFLIDLPASALLRRGCESLGGLD